MMSDDEEFDELPSAGEAKVASDERELLNLWRPTLPQRFFF